MYNMYSFTYEQRNKYVQGEIYIFTFILNGVHSTTYTITTTSTSTTPFIHIFASSFIHSFILIRIEHHQDEPKNTQFISVIKRNDQFFTSFIFISYSHSYFYIIFIHIYSPTPLILVLLG